MLIDSSILRRLAHRSTSKQSVSVRRTRRAIGTSFGRAIGRMFEALETRRLLALVADFGGNKTLSEGSSININGLASTVDAPATIVSYRWDLNYNVGVGFRTTVTGPGFNFNASDGAGTRNIALRVVSSTGATNTTTGTITINNVAPTLGFTVPTTANEGQEFTVAFARLADPGVDTLTGWTIDWGDTTTSSYAPNVMDGAHTYRENGSYTVTLTATDEDGTYTATRNITVNNVVPIVNVTPASQTINEGGTATVNFATTNRVGTLELWTIDWGDGNTGVYDVSESSASHTFADNGSYTVTVTGVEPDGATDGYGTSTVVVNNVNPAVTISGTPTSAVDEGDAVSLTANPTDVGVDDTFSYAWTVTRNGQAYNLTGITANAANLAFSPTDDGAYDATVTVTDDDGGTVTASASFTVVNVAPVVGTSVSPSNNVAEGDSVTVSTSVSDVAGDTTFTYAWSVTKDNAPFSLPNNVATDQSSITFTPTDNGNYVATVVVTDDDGGVTTIASSAISVTNVAPVSSFSESGTTGADEGDSLAFASTPTDAGADDTFTYAWSVTLNGSPVDLTGITTNSSTFDFVPADNGTYVVTHTVTDDDGASHSATSTFSVSNVAPGATTGFPTGDLLEGSAITFNGSAGDVGSADTLTYSWTVTKNNNPFNLTGVTTNAATFTFTPDDNGVYSIDLTVTDDDGGTAGSNYGLTIGNVDPTPGITDVTVPTTEGSQAEFSASATDPGSVDTTTGFSYSWIAKLNGTTIANATGGTFQFTPQDNGSVEVTLVAEDKDGGVEVTTSTFTVGNVNPTGSITGAPGANINEGTDVNLTAVPADAGADDTFTYLWSVTKDGNAYAVTDATSNTFQFSPDDNGTYVATVVITDDNGGTVSVSSSNIVADNVAPVASIGGLPGGNVNEGTTTTLSAGATDAGSADTFSYAWTVTRSASVYATGTAATFDFVPDDEGTYTVELVITDDDGGVSSTSSSTIVANNVNPTGVISAVPANIMEGVQVDLTSTVQDNGSADTLSYVWSVTRNGSNYAVTGNTSANFSFTPDDDGDYVVSLDVTDGDGGTFTASSSTISVANENPGATITGAPTTGIEGTAITVGSTVSDVAGDTVTRAWSVTKDGNPYSLTGVTTNAANFTFTPNDNGSYVITLNVTDEDGGANSVSTDPIAVANANPTASITEVTLPSVEGDAAEFHAGATDAGAADTSFTYNWDVKIDGQDYFTWTGPILVFTAPDNGSYTVTLTATDKDSGVSSSVTNTYSITNATPTGTISGQPSGSVNEGSGIALNAVPADLGTADTHTYSWSGTKDGNPIDLSGTTTNTQAFAYTPNDEGDFVFTVRIADDDGAHVDVSTNTITVVNVGPTVTITGATTGTEAVALTLGTTVTDAGSTDTVASYLWSVTKDGNPFSLTGVTVNAATLTFTPDDNGTYVASVTVTDNDGGSTTETHSIAVANANPTGSITGTPSLAPEGGTIFVGSTASDVAADTITRTWSVLKDGNAYTLGGGVVTNGNTFNFNPNDNGAFVIRLTLSDEDGGSTVINSSAITVTNANPTVTISGTPGGSVVEGSTTTLTANASDPGSADTFSYLWTVTKNGSSYSVSNNTSGTFAFTPNDNGVYAVSVLVTDDDGSTASATTSNITVTNVTPSASISGTPGGAINEGTSVSLTANASDPGSVDNLAYAWSVTKNGSNYAVSNNTSSTFSFTPNDEGTYVATVVVTDKDGATVTVATSSVVVNNVAPTATFFGMPGGSMNEGTAVLVTLDVIDPGSTDTFSYAWSVTKNGFSFHSSTDSSFYFRPNDQGTYAVSLVLSDNDGGSSTISVGSITVVNAPPTVTIDGTTSGMNEGGSTTLTAGVTDPSSIDTSAGFTYSWEVTRGSTLTQTGSGSTFTFAPTDSGMHAISLRATDKDGGSSITVSRFANVGNVAPTPAISGLPVSGYTDEGTEHTFTATSTDPSSADTTAGITYAWTIARNGTTEAVGTGNSITHTIVDEGTYTVTLTATDKDGAVGTTSGTFIAENSAAAVSISRDDSDPVEGQQTTFEVSVEDPGTLDTHTFTWAASINNEVVGTGSGSTFDFTPADNGVYSIAVTATDNGGAVSSYVYVLEVDNASPTVAIGELPEEIVEGSPLTINSIATDPGSADVAAGLTYSWTLTRGGQTVTMSGGSSLTFVPEDNGSYTINVTVTDKDGAISSVASQPFTVANADPTATITGNTAELTEGNSVMLGANVSDPSDVDEEEGFAYSWTVLRGDNVVDTGAGSSFDFSPTDNGIYTVELTVTDKDDGEYTTSRTISVGSAAPVPTINGLPSGSVVENTEISLTAGATDASSSDVTAGFTYGWSVTRGATVIAYSNTANLTFVVPDNGTYTVSLTVTDKDNANATTTGTVIATNVAPASTAITGLPETNVVEGNSVTLGVTSLDAPDDGVAYAWTVTRDSTIVQTGTGEEFVFTAPDNGLYTVAVVATDKDGASGSATATITVTNANPTATLEGPAFTPVRGQTFGLSLAANDVPADAGLTYSINWGDGSTVSTGTVGVGSITKSFANAGTYNVVVTVTDKDGGTATVSRAISVATATLQANPLQSGTTALVVGGTSNADSIRIETGATAGSYRVRFNGSLIPGTWTPTGNTVVAYGYGGDDNISLFRVSPRAVFLGGEGNDSLTGATNADVLVGAAGNDLLDASDARDILIGGTGRDSLVGGNGDDLLLAGRFSNEESLTSLTTLFNQWNSSDAQPTRVTTIRATTLASGNVFNDSPIADSLIAGAGRDWFLVDPTQDVLVDFTPGTSTPDLRTDIR
jgi:PKD repeat protein